MSTLSTKLGPHDPEKEPSCSARAVRLHAPGRVRKPRVQTQTDRESHLNPTPNQLWDPVQITILPELPINLSNQIPVPHIAKFCEK